MRVAMEALDEVHPGVDLRRRMIAPPLTVSWEDEPWSMGAFNRNLPGHYRYQRGVFTHFVQRDLEPRYRASSWPVMTSPGRPAGPSAVQTALNAVWGVMTHLGGATRSEDPGPGDRFDVLAPVALPED